MKVGYGDKSSLFNNAIHNQRLKSDIEKLSAELSSGRRSSSELKRDGDLQNLSPISTRMLSIDAFISTSRDAALFFQKAQSALGNIQDLTLNLAPNLLSAGNLGTEPGLSISVKDGAQNFDTIISALNLSVAGRSIFAGASVDTAPVAEADVILADLSVAISSETTAAGIEAAVNNWFDSAGGGFESVGYLGNTENLGSFRIGEGKNAEFAIRADSQEVRDILKGYSIIALVGDGALSTDLAERSELVRRASERLMQANDDLNSARGELGISEEKIENSIVSNQAEMNSLQLSEAKLLEADPFRAATEIQAAENQLQYLFAITARLSRLSLLNYLQ